ncbi:MAG: hypothetical protein HY721_29660 [Planctomycetes bacterium]|nr:hypothetical protein [Planctomycetota bacterium]
MSTTLSRRLSSWRIAAFALACACAGALPRSGALAQGGGLQIYPPDAVVDGRTVADWGACWWCWVASIPGADNPLFDETGEKCTVAQSGPVWFLAGILNESGKADRSQCVVPAGKKILVPVLNCGSFETTVPCAGLPAGCAALDDTDLLDVTADGVPVPNMRGYRVLSRCFTCALPEDNILDVAGGDYNLISDGFYLLFEPPAPGDHTISYKSGVGDFRLEISYELTVVPSLRRGDVNGDGIVNIADPVSLLNCLFLGSVCPSCPDAADADDDGRLILTDSIYTLNWLFLGGRPPPPPGPEDCGADLTPDALEACVSECQSCPTCAPCGGLTPKEG